MLTFNGNEVSTAEVADKEFIDGVIPFLEKFEQEVNKKTRKKGKEEKRIVALAEFAPRAVAIFWSHSYFTLVFDTRVWGSDLVKEAMGSISYDKERNYGYAGSYGDEGRGPFFEDFIENAKGYIDSNSKREDDWHKIPIVIMETFKGRLMKMDVEGWGEIRLSVGELGKGHKRTIELSEDVEESEVVNNFLKPYLKIVIDESNKDKEEELVLTIIKVFSQWKKFRKIYKFKETSIDGCYFYFNTGPDSESSYEFFKEHECVA